MIGTSIEFYDFFIFATAAAIVFPKIFFPEGVSPFIGLIASFSTFAIGFFARPVGAAVFGHFGDRLGRKTMLVVAMLLMGVATTLIGLLPSHRAIGDFAPLLLVLLRVVQGFALGGQWGGAVLIIVENAPRGERGWYGSFAQVGAPLGTILANMAFLIASSVMPQEDFMAWGWRLPFLASVLLIGLSMFIHFRMDETIAFRELKEAEQLSFAAEAKEVSRTRGIGIDDAAIMLAQENKQSPALSALRRYPIQILTAAGTFIGMQASYYIMVSFTLAYGTSPNGGGMLTSVMLAAVMIGAMVMVPGVFLGGWLSDRIGRRPVIIVSAVLLAGWMFAVFPLIEHGSLSSAALGLAVGQLLNGVIFGPLAALYAETFVTKVRYSGMSLAYQLGTLIGGALAPLIATALFAQSGNTYAISAYVALMCLISAGSAWLITETYQLDLRDKLDTPPSGGAESTAPGLILNIGT